MKVVDFDYDLPSELIAQAPIEPRDNSRLMVVDRKLATIRHDHFYNLGKYLEAEDMLVFNNSKVFPARLYGKKVSGGRVEVLLIKFKIPKSTFQTTKSKSQISNSNNQRDENSKLKTQNIDFDKNCWEVLVRNLGSSQEVIFDHGLIARVIEKQADGTYTLEFNQTGQVFWKTVEAIGHVPLPPYIRYESNLQIPGTKHQTNSKSQEQNSIEYIKHRYQTVYAKAVGSAAAPTAGLHFTQELIARLRNQNIHMTEVTLHVGLGTFQPLSADKVADNKLHSEYYEINEDSIQKIQESIKNDKRVVGVGTTTVRVLESWAKTGQPSGETEIFIYPPYEFKVVNKLITNFHLPKSSLLMLVCAFGGTDLVMRAYEEAVREKYRFFSFGDAMLLI